ncbi:flagellin [Pseudoxanthomonas japonensis]|uniref:Flagellin n=3 Tax=Pseudoxanthomonas TaxID=83618 RepID=A0ABQ6ZF10_9GAMM|nr:flagellin [Pseudoxanthomonas japonensis]KAF1724064.1 flagellin [Pseudoxanthomonas japonensis]
MAQVINTNTMSLNAQRNLSTSGASLATTIQRLSSGLRINSAKDDAAGLAISERFSTQIRGLDVAVRNANDGISLAQVAEGSLTEIGNNLQRIRELSVQSANATNSSSDRAALNAEVKQLTAEIDRVAKQSDFNGTKLLDGSFSSQLFQVGANAGQAIAIDKVVNAKADALGGSLFASASFTANAAGTAGAGPYSHNAVTIAAFTVTNGGNTVSFDAIDVAASGATYATAAEAGVASQIAQGNAIAAAVNAKTADTGVTAEVNATTGAVSFSSWKEGAVGDQITSTLAGGTLTNTAIAAGDAKFADDLDISSFAGAQRALQIVDKALNAVNGARADLGAVQNRFTSVVANLQTSSENLAASRSRIRDTDFAKETAELTRTQILQQAGTAMLAQANQVPQNVMSLLR